VGDNLLRSAFGELLASDGKQQDLKRAGLKTGHYRG